MTLLNTMVIGPEQFGWNAAVTVMSKIALPFCTGTSSPLVKVYLFPAFGLFSPGFTHAASALTTTVICEMSPRPATFPETLMVFVPSVIDRPPTKCALPATRTAHDCERGDCGYE